MVITVVGSVVGHLCLNAGSGGAGVTAAEGHSIHQILAINITANAARKKRNSKGEDYVEGQEWAVT